MIDDEYRKSVVLLEIYSELAKHGEVKEASLIMQTSIDFAKLIANENDNNRYLRDLSIEMVKQENWSKAEKIGKKITESIKRHSLWRVLATKTKAGESLEKAVLFNNEEARTFFLKGWVDVNKYETSIDLIKLALYLLKNDPNSIKDLLQPRIINQIFFEELPKKKILRFNNSLNLQWAIDLKNELDQLPN